MSERKWREDCQNARAADGHKIACAAIERRWLRWSALWLLAWCPVRREGRCVKDAISAARLQEALENIQRGG
jgi:hypothetical protein